MFLRRAHLTVAIADWAICLHPVIHPRYISWEKFMANQRRPADTLTDLKQDAPAHRARTQPCYKKLRLRPVRYTGPNDYRVLPVGSGLARQYLMPERLGLRGWSSG